MSIGIHRTSSMESEQQPSAPKYKDSCQHGPRATFVVTTPGDRGKHNRGHISVINANSALLRHARARLVHDKVTGVDNRPRARRPRNKRAPTADSGYQSDHLISPEDDQQTESECSFSPSKISFFPRVTSRSGVQVRNGHHNESGRKLSSSGPYHSTLDKILQSTLDPFLRLPIDLCRYEKSLLHFYLTDARTLVFGNSPRPMYDVAVHCAELLVEHSVLFNVAKIASAESILCKARGKDLSPMFYALRARVYNMMNQMLDSTETTFFDKVESFHQLGVMEMYLNHSAGQKQHLQAMWQYIEAHGGCSRFLRSDWRCKGTLGIGVYSADFVYIDTPIPPKTELEVLVSRFISSLETARVWYGFRRSYLQQHNKMAASPSSSGWELPNLRIYLDWLIEECLKKQEISEHLAKGAYYSIYNLFMTPVIFDYEFRDSEIFLRQIENCMQQRPALLHSELEDVPELVPISHILQGTSCLFSYARSLLSSDRQGAEVELCESSMDALKVFPLLSCSSILRLARHMIRSLLMVVNGHGENTDSFDKDFLRDLTWEVVETWKSKSCVDETELPEIWNTRQPFWEIGQEYVST